MHIDKPRHKYANKGTLDELLSISSFLSYDLLRITRNEDIDGAEGLFLPSHQGALNRAVQCGSFVEKNIRCH